LLPLPTFQFPNIQSFTRRRLCNVFECTENTAVTSDLSATMFGPQSLMPLMKALGIDQGTQLAHPSMWRNSKQRDVSTVLLHSETGDTGPSTLLRANDERKDTPNSPPSDGPVQDQLHPTLFAYFNNPRDIFSSPRTLLSVVAITGQGPSGVSGPMNTSLPQAYNLHPVYDMPHISARNHHPNHPRFPQWLQPPSLCANGNLIRQWQNFGVTLWKTST